MILSNEWWCAVRRLLAKKGILDKKTQKQLNRVNVSLFTPCLLFSKVAFSLTPSKLKELWIIPILFAVVTGVSAVIAFLVGTALRLRRSQRNFAIAATMFNNSNSLPIALMYVSRLCTGDIPVRDNVASCHKCVMNT